MGWIYPEHVMFTLINDELFSGIREKAVYLPAEIIYHV